MTGWGRYAWVVVWVLSGFFSSARPGDPRFVAALVVGVLVGVLWQVIARRDVGRRLTSLAALGLLGGIFWAVEPQAQQESMSADSGPAIYFLGVVCAVILTEQVLVRRALGPVTLDMVHAPEDDNAAQRPG